MIAKFFIFLNKQVSLTPATSFLCFCLILSFLFLMLLPGSTFLNLILWGAKQNGLIAQGETFRILTASFLHSHFWHLTFNLLALWSLGKRLEPWCGSFGILFLFLLGSASGNLLSFLFSPAMSLGASGAVFAFASCLVLFERPFPHIPRAEKRGFLFVLILNFLISLILPFLDLFQHLGGLFAGCGAGLLLLRFKQPHIKILGLIPQSTPAPSFLWLIYWIIINAFLLFAFEQKKEQISSFELMFGQSLKKAALIEKKQRKKESVRFYHQLFQREKIQNQIQKLFLLAHKEHQKERYGVAYSLYHTLTQLDQKVSLEVTNFPLLPWLIDWKIQSQSDLLPTPSFPIESEPISLKERRSLVHFFGSIHFLSEAFWLSTSNWDLSQKQQDLILSGAYLILLNLKTKNHVEDEDYEHPLSRHFKEEIKRLFQRKLF